MPSKVVRSKADELVRFIQSMVVLFGKVRRWSADYVLVKLTNNARDVIR